MHSALILPLGSADRTTLLMSFAVLMGVLGGGQSVFPIEAKNALVSGSLAVLRALLML